MGLTAPAVVAVAMGMLALQAPDGRTEVRDLESGKLVWRTVEAGIPLAFDKDRLVVGHGADPAQVRIYDGRKGGPALVTSEAFPLPAWRTQVTRAGLKTTSVQVGHWTEGGRLMIQWRRNRTEITGMERPRIPAEHGLISIHLVGGQVDVSRRDAPIERPPLPPPGVLQEHGSAAS